MRVALRGTAWPSVAAAGTLLPHLLVGYFEGIDSERGLE
jgi:hypothetical protein